MQAPHASLPPLHLTDEQWAAVAALLPQPHSRRGRPPHDLRPILDGVLWKLASGQPWYDLPADYPLYQTCYSHYRRWQRLRVMPQILKALLADLKERAGLDPLAWLEEGTIRLVPHSRAVYLVCTRPVPEEWQRLVVRLFLASCIGHFKRSLAKLPPPRRNVPFRVLILSEEIQLDPRA